MRRDQNRNSKIKNRGSELSIISLHAEIYIHDSYSEIERRGR